MSASMQLYFAYGSNLWLEQMAARCPNSTFIGTAILPDYRWQINERGVANVVRAAGYSVHGLVFELGPGDETNLDLFEGVGTDAYSKTYHSVILRPSWSLRKPPSLLRMTDGAHPWVASHTQKDNEAARAWDSSLIHHVLVYASDTYIISDAPRDEYVRRMNLAIEDAAALGVPTEYIDNAIRCFIPSPPPK
ncbi:hypothetical protein GGR50DRAFT_187955 [Xylaria sp. CBS 124048]|nr:hypothetical protein GGR50DRAFT_187955 [Xylaria sp. CBS 124048]